MMWCGQTQFGRIVTSHPALEGTFCGPNKWCSLGRCVPWTGMALPPPSTMAPITTSTIQTTSIALPTVGNYRTDWPVRPPPINLPQPQPAWLLRTKANLRGRQLSRGRAVVPIEMFYTPKKTEFDNTNSFRLRKRRMQ
jgi:hypothetical protein